MDELEYTSIKMRLRNCQKCNLQSKLRSPEYVEVKNRNVDVLFFKLEVEAQWRLMEIQLIDAVCRLFNLQEYSVLTFDTIQCLGVPSKPLAQIDKKHEYRLKLKIL